MADVPTTTWTESPSEGTMFGWGSAWGGFGWGSMEPAEIWTEENA